MRKVQFVLENFYHIFNRGVDKRNIFEDQADYRRFYASMFLFNNSLFIPSTGRETSVFTRTSLSDVQSDVHHSVMDEPRELLVRIISFCLMPNHFHMLLEPLVENGISKFMHRFTMGYVKYFNKRYKRTGALFEGEFKAVLAKRDAQFEHLPRYIHLNALDLADLKWRDGKVEDWNKALGFLEQYPWSSHPVYIGKSQPLQVVEPGVMSQIFDTPEKYLRFLKGWAGREFSTDPSRRDVAYDSSP